MTDSPAEVRRAQYLIFNKLCSEYIRTRDESFMRATDIRTELNIAGAVFDRALLVFKVGDGTVVEVLESNGLTYIRLGEAARLNCE
jgi:hypothetical protein